MMQCEPRYILLPNTSFKSPSDLKQNGIQEKTPFSDTYPFTWCGGLFYSECNLIKPPSNWIKFLTANQKLLFNGFISYNFSKV